MARLLARNAPASRWAPPVMVPFDTPTPVVVVELTASSSGHRAMAVMVPPAEEELA
jgi:hypothetical protein